MKPFSQTMTLCKVGKSEKEKSPMRFKRVLLCLGLSAGLALFGIAGCGDDDGGSDLCGNDICDEGETTENCPDDCYCGNGTVDPGEDCDGADLNGMTCIDVDCASGTLGCTNSCAFDRSRCNDCETECGDGVVEGDEECDCGDDPNNLPAACEAINGEGTCNTDCTWDAECGNGIVEGNEECDCGTDPDNLPEGCDGINGSGDGHCSSSCTEQGDCDYDTFAECDPLNDAGCCPDQYGNEYMCTGEGLNTSVCVLECGGTEDCYYGMYCEAGIAGGACWWSLCGPSSSMTPLNAPCQITGGGEGWCLPLGAAEDELGVCVEHGDGAHGDNCDYVEGSSIDTSFQPRDMEWDRCDKGFCAEEAGNEGGGECLQFCDWEVAYYDGESDCPAGNTCLDLSYIMLTDDESDGLRSSEFGYCIEESIDPAVGIVGCDIVNGEVLPGRTGTCAQYNDAENDNFICWPIHFGDGEMGWGTPVGWCVNVGEPANKMLGEVCDIENDLCEEGSFCFPTDTTDWTSEGQCMAFCDMSDDNCATRGDLPSDSFCISVSAWYRPGNSQGTTDDGSPAHLGMCGCPEGGCTGGTSICGNDTIEGDEVCDGTDTPDTCEQYDEFTGGTMGCAGTCDATDPSGCTNN